MGGKTHLLYFKDMEVKQLTLAVRSCSVSDVTVLVMSMDSFVVEGASKGHLVQIPSNEQGHPQLHPWLRDEHFLNHQGKQSLRF